MFLRIAKPIVPIFRIQRNLPALIFEVQQELSPSIRPRFICALESQRGFQGELPIVDRFWPIKKRDMLVWEGLRKPVLRKSKEQRIV
jgi:hypothetical protein